MKPTYESTVKWLRLHGEIDRATAIESRVAELQEQIDRVNALIDEWADEHCDLAPFECSEQLAAAIKGEK